jgi:hypothetical protein
LGRPPSTARPVYTDVGTSFFFGVAVTRFDVWTVHSMETDPLTAYPYSYAYATEADDRDGAVSNTIDLLGWEQAIHRGNVNISYAAVGRDDEGSPDPHAVLWFQFGDAGGTSLDFARPEWVIMVRWFSVGRAVGRKFLRLGLLTDDVTDGILNASYVSLIESAYVAPLVASGLWYSRGGPLVDEGRVDPRLRLYQTRHGTLRRRYLVI